MEKTDNILRMIREERVRQEAQYGEANTTTRSGTGPGVRWLLPYTFDDAEQIQRKLREDYENVEATGNAVTWAMLVREEVAESFELEPDDPRLVEELVQVAALCVSWAERLVDGGAR